MTKEYDRMGEQEQQSVADREQEFEDLLRRVQLGSQEAAREVFDRYAPHVIRVIRRRLDPRLRSQFDSVDFLQSALASFFALEPQRYHFPGPEALIAFLAKVAERKVIEAYRHRLQTQRYGAAREYPLEHSEDGPETEPAGRVPTPSQVAVAQEEWDRLRADLPEHYQRILNLLRQEYTHEEIARAMGLNQRTVRRVVRLLALRVKAP